MLKACRWPIFWQWPGPGAAESLLGCWLGYTETKGAPDVLAAVADTYDSLSPSQILCFAGAEEGIYAAMRVLLTRQDHAIVVVPNYQAAETLPLEICAVTGVPLRAEQGWQLDLDAVRAAIRPNTRLISVNFPNNPTGAVPDHATFAALVDLCRQHGIWLFSDEVYRLLERDEARRLPQAADVYERGISLNVMSKAYGLPGLRVGWLACQDTALLERIQRYKYYLSICNSVPSERLTVLALGVRDRIIARNRALIADNLAVLDRFFAEYPGLFDWRHPDGGCIGYPRYLGRDGVEDFCRGPAGGRRGAAAAVFTVPVRADRRPGRALPDRFRAQRDRGRSGGHAPFSRPPGQQCGAGVSKKKRPAIRGGPQGVWERETHSRGGNGGDGQKVRGITTVTSGRGGAT